MQAFLCALTYYVCQIIDGVLGFQTMTRPIILGPVVGLACGDLKTGVIMGAELEAIFMGISGIGGVVPSDYRTATCVGVALTILSGITLEQGLVIASAAGSLMSSLTPITNSIMAFIQPIQTRTANEGNVKAFWRNMWLQMLLIRQMIPTIILFLAVYFGSDAIATVIANVPSFILGGLSAAGGMLVVVGLCLTTMAIYSSSTVFYVLLGFVLTKYLGLGTLPVAILGVIIAYVGFTRNYAVKQLEEKITSGGDDFYG